MSFAGAGVMVSQPSPWLPREVYEPSLYRHRCGQETSTASLPGSPLARADQASFLTHDYYNSYSPTTDYRLGLREALQDYRQREPQDYRMSRADYSRRNAPQDYDRMLATEYRGPSMAHQMHAPTGRQHRPQSAGASVRRSTTEHGSTRLRSSQSRAPSYGGRHVFQEAPLPAESPSARALNRTTPAAQIRPSRVPEPGRAPVWDYQYNEGGLRDRFTSPKYLSEASLVGGQSYAVASFEPPYSAAFEPEDADRDFQAAVEASLAEARRQREADLKHQEEVRREFARAAEQDRLLAEERALLAAAPTIQAELQDHLLRERQVVLNQQRLQGSRVESQREQAESSPETARTQRKMDAAEKLAVAAAVSFAPRTMLMDSGIKFAYEQTSENLEAEAYRRDARVRERQALFMDPVVSKFLMHGPSGTGWDQASLREEKAKQQFHKYKVAFFPINDSRDLTMADAGSHWTLLVCWDWQPRPGARTAGDGFFTKFRFYNSLSRDRSASDPHLRHAQRLVTVLSGQTVTPEPVPVGTCAQQTNCYDCGVYVIHFSDIIARHCQEQDPAEVFSPWLVWEEDLLHVTPEVIENERRTHLDRCSQVSTQSAMAAVRIACEEEELRANPPAANCYAGPVSSEDLFKWRARIHTSVHGYVEFDMRLPLNYPEKPPVVKLADSREVFARALELQMLKPGHWNPELGIRGVLTAIRSNLRCISVEAVQRASSTGNTYNF